MKNPSTISSGESDERAAFLDLARMYCAVTETPSGDLEWSFAQCDIENFASEVVAKHRAALATQPAESKACASVGVESVPPIDALLVGDDAQAHDQCRAVIHMALALADVYRARAMILSKMAGAPVDVIGDSSAAAMEWLGDHLSNMDACDPTDEWMDPVFEKAQARWPASPAPSVGEPDTTMWAVQITGPDDLYAAPDRQVADAVALVLNRQFARHPFPDEVRVSAEVVAWPHGYESWSAQKDLLQLEVRGIES